MPSITANDWNSLNSRDQEQAGFKIQEHINKVRRQFENNSFSGLISTQSDSNEENSYSGISSLLRLAVTTNNNENNWFDARDWVRSIQELKIENLVSVPSSKKTSVSEWVSYVRNNLVSLNERELMADRISLLATDVESNEDVLIDERSLATFLMFLSSNKIEKRPSIGLTSNGYIDALWRCSKNLLIEIIFHPGHESQVVTFSHDLEDAEVINKRVATLPIANIMSVISNRNLDSLFSSDNDFEYTHVA